MRDFENISDNIVTHNEKGENNVLFTNEIEDWGVLPYYGFDLRTPKRFRYLLLNIKNRYYIGSWVNCFPGSGWAGGPKGNKMIIVGYKDKTEITKDNDPDLFKEIKWSYMPTEKGIMQYEYYE